MTTSNKAPDAARLTNALEATWPPARVWKDGPFLHRDGAGGGQRVSATTCRADSDITTVAALLPNLTRPLFRVADDDAPLATLLNDHGFQRHDATLFRCADAKELSRRPKVAEVFFGWPSLAQHRRLWQTGGIGPARINVMSRVTTPKTALLARLGDSPAGTAFVALNGDMAMLHALEVHPDNRRRGVARRLTEAAAWWAMEHGARWLALAVTQANVAANQLYQSMGLAVSGGYHYRLKREEG